MKLRTCACCGTEYDRTLSRCPHCGEAPAEKEKKDDRIPRWMWAVICAVLGLAVVIGFAYFLYSMDYLGLKSLLLLRSLKSRWWKSPIPMLVQT